MEEDKKEVQKEESKVKPEDLIKAPIRAAKHGVDIMKPVRTRMMNRYKELQAQGRAKNEKLLHGRTVEWVTTPPEILLRNLEMYMENGKGIITYDLYLPITEKNKCIHNEWKEGMDHSEKYHEVKNDVIGNKWLNEQAEPVVTHMVVETIVAHKPIQTDKTKV